MSKLVNIKIEESATFSKALTITKDIVVASEVHPITGRQTKITSTVPVSLKGYSLIAQIKDKFDNPTFTISLSAEILSAEKGLAMLGLSREQTARLAILAPAVPTGVGSDRTYKIGYYDVLAINTQGDATRLFYGECYLTRAVSKDPRVTVGEAYASFESPILPVTSNIELRVDATLPKHYVGIRYYKNLVQVTPTSGDVNIYRKSITSNVFNTVPSANLDSSVASEEAFIVGNTSVFKAVPHNIRGADGFKLVVASNLY